MERNKGLTRHGVGLGRNVRPKNEIWPSVVDTWTEESRVEM